jgi:hypothetical protein
MDSIGSGKRILDKISNRIIRITSSRMVLASFIGFMISFILINVRPFGAEQLLDITGGVGLLDMELLYTPEQAYTHLAAMGEAGRAFDLTHIVPLDFIFPFMYTLFFAVTITWLLHRWLPAQSGWHRLNVIPLIGGIADYMENLGIITMIAAWPAQLPVIALFTMVADLVKFTFFILAILIIIGALAGWIVSRIKGRSVRIPAL